jgi:3',5'-nucleoside bisphosphate phosphatase
VTKAQRQGIRVLSLTDHDSVAGIDEAWEAGRSRDIEVVPGVELSIANDPERDLWEIHVLGYFVNHRHPDLVGALKRAGDARTEQKLNLARNMQALGFDVPIDEVMALAGDGAPGRMHVAQVAWQRNPGRFVDRDEIFRDYISVGGRAYVPRSFQIDMEGAAHLVRRAGGLPTLAHPGVYRWREDAEARIRQLAGMGIEGLEGPYTYDKNRPHVGMAANALDAIIERFSCLARYLDLYLTGGSDYHGARKSVALGEQGLSEAAFTALRRSHER